MNIWTVIWIAIGFRLIETIAKVKKETGKIDFLSVIDEFLKLG